MVLKRHLVIILLAIVSFGCASTPSAPPSPVPPQVHTAVGTPPVEAVKPKKEKTEEVKPRVWAPPVEKGYEKPEKKERWLKVKLYDGGGVSIPCGFCGGGGSFPCRTCSGTGSVLRPTGLIQPVTGKILTESLPCPTCLGAGGKPCAVCKGSGRGIERG